MTTNNQPEQALELNLGTLEVLNNKGSPERIFGFINNIRRSVASRAIVSICSDRFSPSELELPSVIAQRLAEWFLLEERRKNEMDCHDFQAFLVGHSTTDLTGLRPLWGESTEVISHEQLLALKTGETIVLVLWDDRGQAGCVHSAMKVGEDQWLSKLGKKTGLLSILSLEDIFKIYPEEAYIYIAKVKMVPK